MRRGCVPSICSTCAAIRRGCATPPGGSLSTAWKKPSATSSTTGAAAPPRWPPRRDRERSGRLAHRRHIEVGYPKWWHGGPVEVIRPFPRQRPLGGAHLGGPPEQVDGALVEAEVFDRADHLAPLDQIDAVAGEAGQQQRLGVDLTDIPEAGQQQ